MKMRGGGSRSSAAMSARASSTLALASAGEAGGGGGGAGGRGDRLGGQALVLADRHRDEPSRETGKVAQEALAILVRQHADDEHYRARYALVQVGKRRRDD